MHTIVKFIALFLLLAFSAPAFANVNAVAGNPTVLTVPAQGTTLQLVWRVTRTEPVGVGGAVTRTVSSPSAQLIVGGVPVATLGSALSATSTLLPGASETLEFRETLQVSAAIAERILKEAAGNVLIGRSFSDTQTTNLDRIPVFAGGGSSANGIDVRRIELTFEGKGGHTDVVHKGDAVRAIASVAFRGTGVLKGEWRIVDPTASLGSGGRRVLKTVHVNLVSAGQGMTRIVSPDLPTNEGGLYLLSFSVTDTNENFEIPILRYYVIDSAGRAAPVNLDAVTPADGVVVSKDTVFSWKPLPAATAYQLEIFEKGADVPLTGKLVPANHLKLSLTGLTLGHLVSGKKYDWQVQALGAGGNALGRSEKRTITAP